MSKKNLDERLKNFQKRLKQLSEKDTIIPKLNAEIRRLEDKKMHRIQEILFEAMEGE